MAEHVFVRDHQSFSATRQPPWLEAAVAEANAEGSPLRFALTVRRNGIEAGATMLRLPEERGFVVMLVSADGNRRLIMFGQEATALSFFLEQGAAFARAVAETVQAEAALRGAAAPPVAPAIAANANPLATAA